MVSCPVKKAWNNRKICDNRDKRQQRFGEMEDDESKDESDTQENIRVNTEIWDDRDGGEWEWHQRRG